MHCKIQWPGIILEGFTLSPFMYICSEQTYRLKNFVASYCKRDLDCFFIDKIHKWKENMVLNRIKA